MVHASKGPKNIRPEHTLWSQDKACTQAGWWFQIHLLFFNLGEMIQFDEHIFQRGLVQPPTSLVVLQRRVWFISLGVSTPCPQLLTVMCPAGMCRKYCLRNLGSNAAPDDFHQLCFCAFFVRKDEGKKSKS